MTHSDTQHVSQCHARGQVAFDGPFAGIKPGAFWLQDAFCNLLATFTDSILAPR